MYNYRSIPFRIIATAIILCVMASRVYLGVHTATQVFGGLFFGALTVWAMTRSFGRMMFDSLENGSTGTYWAICVISILICLIISKITMPLTLGLVGVLIGYGLSLSFAKNHMTSPKSRPRLAIAGLGLVSLWLVNRFFPKIHFAPATLVDAIFIVKYCIIGVIIFAVVPLIARRQIPSGLAPHPAL